MRRLTLLVVALGSLGGPALAADFGPPPTEEASPDGLFSGYVEGFGGYGYEAFLASDFFTADYGGHWGLGGAGRFNLNFAPGWSGQFDVFGDRWRVSNPDFIYDPFGSFGAALHLSARNPSSYLLGVFGGVAEVTTYYDAYGFSGVFYGAEGQAYWGNFTLYGQVGGYNSTGGGTQSYAPIDEFFARLVGRYFVTPNTKIEVGVGTMSGDIWGPSFPDTTFLWNAKLEHKLAATPLSIFAEVSGAHSSYVQSLGADPLYRAKVGLKVSFGSETLQDQNNNGATLDTPDFGVIGWIRSNNFN